MSSFLETLKIHYNNKYQKTLVNEKYLKLRNDNFKKILNLPNQNFVKIKKYQHKNILITRDFLCNNLNIKNSKNKKILTHFYKKFNYSLKLKKKYNKKMTKLSNTNEHFSSYIFLGNHLIKLNNISELQKLNTILKINDITLINFNKNKNLKLSLFIKKNINYEKKIIRKYAKKFINSSS